MADYIAVTEQDMDTAQGVEACLLAEGFLVEPYAPGALLVRQPNAGLVLVIVDLRGRGEDWELFRQVRSSLDRPLLLLCPGANGVERARALDMGTDDCLLKPFLSVELIARVRALLRRETSISRRRQSFFVDGDLTVDRGRREVRLAGRPLELTSTEFRLLDCFLDHVDEVVSPEQLARHLGGPVTSNPENTIKVYVHQLRKKLESHTAHPARIVTWRREGYMFRRIAGGDSQLV